MLLFAVTMLFSCKKEEATTRPIASLTLVNAVVGGKGVKLGGGSFTTFNNGSNQLFLFAGENSLYVWPLADSLNPYYVQSKFTVNDREIYSLFICGVPGSTEGIIVKENIPYRTDSTAGIRFINLAPNKPSLNITLSATTTVNEVSALAYKNYTEFKTYAGLFNSTYSFQVRDAANPTTVLTTFTLAASAVPRFANITLVIRQNGASGVAVFRVNNDR